jgi:hypothetical protein
MHPLQKGFYSLPASKLENMHPLQKGCKRRKILGTDEKKLNIKHLIYALLWSHQQQAVQKLLYIYISLCQMWQTLYNSCTKVQRDLHIP